MLPEAGAVRSVWVRGLLHLLVGGACAALVTWLAVSFWIGAVDQMTGVSATILTASLLALALGLVAAVLLAPPVRQAEVVLARTLLDLDLPDTYDDRSWEGRGRGLLWAVVVIVLGGASLFALLFFPPQAAWLLGGALDPGLRSGLALGLADWPPAALAVLAVVALAVGVLVQPPLVVALRRLAPAVLGPTAADRAAAQQEDLDRLARANTLARELHDSIGHALTGIGVQADAGARVIDRDPAFAREALDQIARTSAAALGELDHVLGLLRAEAGAGTPTAHGVSAADIPALLRDTGTAGVEVTGDLGGVAHGTGATAYRIVQEGITNARRHGTGEVRGRVRADAGGIQIRLDNPAAHQTSSPRGGRGLEGIGERVRLQRGSWSAGPVELGGDRWWRLEASLPQQEDEV